MRKRPTSCGVIAIGALTALTVAVAVSRTAQAMQETRCEWVCLEGDEHHCAMQQQVCKMVNIPPVGGGPRKPPKGRLPPVRNTAVGGTHLTGGNLTGGNKPPSAPLTTTSTSATGTSSNTSLLKKH